MGDRRSAFTVLVMRPDGKRPLGRPKRKYEVNIKMNLYDLGGEAWTALIWLRIGTGGGLL